MSLEKLRAKIEKREAVVGIVGLGYVGICFSAIIADSGFDVIGADINQRVVDQVNRAKAPFYEPGLDDLLSRVIKGGKLRTTTDITGMVKDSDIVIVTVGTPIRGGEIDLTYLKEACKAVGKGLGEGKLVVIKSTVSPGTTEEVVKPILEEVSGLKAGKDFSLVYAPERMAEGKAIKELNTLREVVGGIDEVSSKLMMEFMEKIGVETMHVSNPKTAEMVKMADNLWIDQSIALGNQLALICEKLGIDVQEVIKAANTLPKGGSFVNILLPGLVGGSCLTKDPYFLANLATTKGIDSSLIIAGRKLNESMYLHVVDLVKEAYAEMGKALKGSKIAVLGLAFKGETSDIRESQAISIVRKLKELGADVKVFDPYVKDAPSDITMTSLDDALKGSDCIVVATEHSYFRQLQLEQLSNSVNKPSALVDARGVFNPSKAKNLGFIWRGLGRP